MPLSLGQGSGDFGETSGRVQLYHMGIRNSLGVLSADAFTQATPPIVTAAANVSTTLAGISKTGVLSASVAFTRPDSGNGHHGGAVQVGAAYVAGLKPLGIFLNDAVGNAFENTPGVASGRGPYVSGQGSIGVQLWETQQQISGNAALTYAVGDALYASVNGLLTNRAADAYEWQVTAALESITLMGIVKVAPDADNSLMVLDLRV